MPSYPEAKLRELMAKVFNVPVELITVNASPDNVENWDSLRHMKLVLALEQEFDVELTDDQVVEILSYPLIRIVLHEQGVELE
jgi:acyl carrier protein